MTEIDKAIAETLAQVVPPLPMEDVQAYVNQHYQKRERLLQLWEEQGCEPLYVLDFAAMQRRAEEFRSAFARVLPDPGLFYAVKSNNCPDIAAFLATNGYGLDVSSGVELQMALKTSCRTIVFSGPGKTNAELALAIANADRVTVLMDSFGELDRLATLADDAQITVRAGVRLTPPIPNGWRKFGIPLERMQAFWQAAQHKASVNLSGIQFHTSWNTDPSAQIATIQALGQTLNDWPLELQRQMSFLDIGGGFWPPAGDWLLPDGTPAGQVRTATGSDQPSRMLRHRVAAVPIEQFAVQLAGALHEHILSRIDCRICMEPGRWISNESMHLLFSVVDKKETDLVITDAGTNAIGYERFEKDYVPIINLSRPGLAEHECMVLGSLCTPHDYWGYSYWGEAIEPGDILLMPDLGAYAYSLRQDFIKAPPKLAPL